MAIYQGNKKISNNYSIDASVYSLPIGSIIPFGGVILPTGFLLCDGQAVSKTKYVELYKIVGNLYGESGSEDTFLLPDLRDKFVQGANGNLGTTKEAGLPNITGEVGYIKSIGDGSYWQGININTGVFKSSQQTVRTSPTATTAAESTSHSQPPSTVVFKASDSNSIYGNSDTVQPPSVCLTFIIKALKVGDQYADAVGTLIDDSATNVTDKTWSAKKISDTIDTSKVDAYTKSEADDMFAGKNDTHTHSNKATLDKLSETDSGKATYDGTEIVTVSGATMTGSLVAQANTDYTVAQVRNATMSDVDPTGGSNGQVHYKYS